ncbi:MaoC/PaaZ C-terminal domain-containing protein [Halobellus captivus]|uniref:MaoC/PaaZ C-terminal domain-containing protein n=1 Tax=Halobellus captivus TaxID=2592614 RepID=UPI0011A0FE9F|nr:MaoC/PaaZ C-terminal domain-containing protein [Halobellus captivus]
MTNADPPDSDATPISPPDEPLTYDDLSVGDRFEADQTVAFTREEIVDFATAYDPQPFHLGDEADDASPFEGLVASGLHSYCACNRLATAAFFARVAFLGGRGVDDLRWFRPVEPGDTLSVDVEVVAMRPSDSDPRRGYVDVDVTGRDPAGEPVVSWRVLGLIRRGDADADAAE